MGAFDDITSQYGKAAGNGNAFEDITTEYGYDVGNAPKPTFWDSVKNNAEYVANGVKNNIEWIDKSPPQPAYCRIIFSIRKPVRTIFFPHRFDLFMRQAIR